MESENLKNKVRSQNPDRIVLPPKLMTLLKARINEIQMTFGGGLKIHIRDLVFFILENHCHRLSESEMHELKNKYFDEIKATQWGIDQVKKARARGESITLSEVMKKFNSPRVMKKSASNVSKVKSENDSFGRVLSNTKSIQPEADNQLKSEII